MAERDQATRRYQLLCQNCDATWSATYGVATFHDDAGDHELFYRHGLPALAPWCGIRCPGCGDRRVKVLPPGYHDADAARLGAGVVGAGSGREANA
jgi:hypothetical protein